jgi:hypothetical protein
MASNLHAEMKDLESFLEDIPKFKKAILENHVRNPKKELAKMDVLHYLDILKGILSYQMFTFTVLAFVFDDLFRTDNFMPRSTNNRLVKLESGFNKKIERVSQRLSYQSRQMQKTRRARKWLADLESHTPRTEFDPIGKR